MSREQDSHRKASDSVRCNKMNRHQTRRSRGERNRQEGENAINTTYKGEFYVQKVL